MLGTVYPDYLKMIVDDSLKNRNILFDEEEQAKGIKIKESVYDVLMSKEFISKVNHLNPYLTHLGSW